MNSIITSTLLLCATTMLSAHATNSIGAFAFAPHPPFTSLQQQKYQSQSQRLFSPSVHSKKGSSTTAIYLSDTTDSDNVNINNNNNDENFESLGLSSDLLDATEKMGWHYPTPVQQLSIPAILNMAHDTTNNNGGPNSLWCEAPTGSGKTGGFALPLLQILLNNKRPAAASLQKQQRQLQRQQRSSFEEEEEQGYVSSLILCPTRELAAQTTNVIRRLVSHLPKKHRSAISVEMIHGGVPIEPQVSLLARRRASKSNVDILIATPGRLNDVLRYKDRVDPTGSAMERRILDAFEAKSGEKASYGNKRKGGKRAKSEDRDFSLNLNDIQEMDLDRDDDDGRASLDELLRNLNYLVMDEADRLCGNGFKDEIDELLSLFPRKSEMDVKTLLFSATFPEQIEERVDRVLGRISSGVPLRVSTSVAMLQRVFPAENDDDDDANNTLSNRRQKFLVHATPITTVARDTAPRIQHRAIRLKEADRTPALRHLLESHPEWDRVLVFVGTRYSSEHVTMKLRKYNIKAAELHGKLDQDARERRLGSFRSGKTRVLVSTDLSARGIDVEGLPVVVNYDLPRSAAEFTHRTGRTGRAGNSGLAISFVIAKKESHFDFIEKKEMRGETVEREVLPEFEIDESLWDIESMAGELSTPGAVHSQKGLAHDRMFGGVKGRRKTKKDKLRESAAAKITQKQD